MRKFKPRFACALGVIFWLTLIVGSLQADDSGPPRGHWQEHRIRQGDGKGGWITRPALRQVLRHPDANFTMPFGMARLDNGEIALLCSREKQPTHGPNVIEPIIAFSKDEGGTWSEFAIIPGTKGRPQFLEWLGGGRLSLARVYICNAVEFR